MMKLGSHQNNRVLIVDDQPEIHDDFVEMLRPNIVKSSVDDLAVAFLSEKEESFLPEFELLHANNGEEACKIIRAGKESNHPIALAYIDIRMPPGMDGVETIRRVRQIDRDIEIVIMTAYTDRSLPEIVYDMELLHSSISESLSRTRRSSRLPCLWWGSGILNRNWRRTGGRSPTAIEDWKPCSMPPATLL